MSRLLRSSLLLRSQLFPSPSIHHIRYATTSVAGLSPKEKKKAFSHTLKLPKTSFPLRHKDIVAAEKLQRRKTCDQLYQKQLASNPREAFVLHDGPPYANGHLHMGHALNKVLKDIINRYKVIRGHRVHYVPGWDTHGLPIEQKALAAIGKSHTSLTPSQVRAEARQVALSAIDVQKEEMRALGIMADWDHKDGTYRTLDIDHDFEIRQLQLFQTMIQKELIQYRLRPVYYSPSSRTALAEAELEYRDGHKSHSVYVSFPVQEEDMSEGLRAIYSRHKSGSSGVDLAIWTTTPWTLPGNSGVAVHENLTYDVVRNDHGRLLVIANDRVADLQRIFGHLTVVGSLPGSSLVGSRYTHIFHPPSSPSPKPQIFAGGHVTAGTGTGLVHSAPAHGHEDYVAFKNAGILPDKLRCPVDDAGCFTDELMSWVEDEKFRALVGKAVLGEGTKTMVELLRGEGVLLGDEIIEHRYPYDWKSKQPIIMRATPQWFADVEHIKDDALDALKAVHFHPPQARKRLEAFVLSRNEWCISRQRSWGVPIPVLFDSYGDPVTNADALAHVIQVMKSKGTDHWWSGPVEDFVPPSRKGERLSKGVDTLDVWFDSGSSWTLLRDSKIRDPELPLADVYLEGSDQHRGWFQSSLLTKVTSTSDRRAPYGTVITHGFVMDEKGDKMSKSAGNGLSPMEIIHGLGDSPAYGADTLRLWAASVDYTCDASIGPSSISHASETLRRLRNTARFLLANTSEHEEVSLEDVELRAIDRYVLHQLHDLELVALAGYDSYTFNKVVNALSTFAVSTLSTLYFDIVKDTLYCEKLDSPARLATVAVLQTVLKRMIQIMAPIIPHLAEELYQNIDALEDSSAFLGTWEPSDAWSDPALQKDVGYLLAIKPLVSQLVEEARAAKHVKMSSETELWIAASDISHTVLSRHANLLQSLFGVSRVTLGTDPSSRESLASVDAEIDDARVSLKLLPSSQHQCPRCWLYQSEIVDHLCARCASVVV
ncbi:isoleucine-tRNA ligase [Cryptococcus amylolentus CBS 6273]|uniref:isoleucine--tRNA ligase n=1 Tax=Cryptococcus amylolentus CBS 6273 TaxID=1296118 RepID=A0A1E3JH93_9TREE|nr:isoleucine-tRNA ligase [Cryptococcus amylolentus CBS 6273]